MSNDLKKLDSVLKDIDKRFGAGSAFIIGKSQINNVERWEIEDLVLSDVMGGGLPKGRIIEIYGPESHGKTSIATYLGGQVQKSNGRVAFIDAEHAFDPEYAATLGLNTEDIIFSQPDSGEQAMDIAIALAESGEVDLIIVDSVAALVPKSEIEGQMSDQQMGAQARLLGKACRKIVPALGKNKCSLIFINQLRMKIGITYGNPEVTPGGVAIKFYSTIRLEVRRKEFVGGEEENAIGIISSIKGVKNKVGTPMKKGMVKILYFKGLQVEEETIDYAITFDVISKGGAWYKYLDNKFQGKESVIKFFKDNLTEFDKIKKIVKDRMSKIKIIINNIEENETEEIDENITEEDVILEEKKIEETISQETLINEQKENESRIAVVRDQIAKAVEEKKRGRKPRQEVIISDPEIVDLSKIDSIKE